MNQKKKLRSIAFVGPLLSFAFATLGTGCGVFAEVTGIHMASEEIQNVYYGNFSFEGIRVVLDYRDGSTEEVPLTEEMISEVEQLKFFKVGRQDIEVNYRKRWFTVMPIEVKLNQFKESYALNGYDCVYDGEPHAVTLNQELPEGASITYPYGNIFTNAGSYEVVGVMSKNGYESKTLTTTLNILQASHDVDQITFQDSSRIYNGEIHNIYADNVPEGVEVSYETFGYDDHIRVVPVKAGKYRVVAHFTDSSPNYVKIPDMEAILTIQKAKYDLTGITFEGHSKEYDGENYEPAIGHKELLPAGIDVAYSCKDAEGHVVTSNAAVGTYTMVATFLNADTENFEPIAPMEATLTVAKRVIHIADKVRFDGITGDFNENTVYSLEVTGDLPSNVTVTYENNDQHYAGEYEVKAIFSAVDPNETVDVPELTAFIVITPVWRSVGSYNPDTGKYDAEFSAANIVVENGEASVINIDFDTFRVVSVTFYSLISSEEIPTKDLVAGETYSYTAIFEYLDERMNESTILSRETDNYLYRG